jgi:hypothetical protein
MMELHAQQIPAHQELAHTQQKQLVLTQTDAAQADAQTQTIMIVQQLALLLLIPHGVHVLMELKQEPC